MTYPIISAEKVAVGTTAVNVAVNCRSFLIKNCGDAMVYFTEQSENGATVTAETGFALGAGETCPVSLCAKTLSLIAAAETAVSLLYVGEGW
ncbi:MAG: hypothetical protein IKC24_00150 [Oscillospiraceae bacterium]|nr:hypothetical protein [Oscillospiraceae bacterium]